MSPVTLLSTLFVRKDLLPTDNNRSTLSNACERVMDGGNLKGDNSIGIVPSLNTFAGILPNTYIYL